ncbi:30S ribosomal protein S20 [Ornithinibacillus halotolerans]|uniref:Small ribosomal subunit protein bS20 n=1 Tax=Ornithinibacillus halotolerans TaxID=1274357 RepID=A0A916RTD9_9BACI|nr:30S ribosomal protein S20 [Ornithinibacillus halotolerans]GGA68811.1 30S ribosomal protein S20 [Ornithinibacillus halotolerans]
MANIKSAIKRVGVNNKKRAQNQSFKSEMRSQVKLVEKFVEANDVENAKSALPTTIKKIDKAVQKGLIHKNAGDRQKSRLTKKVNGLGA